MQGVNGGQIQTTRVVKAHLIPRFESDFSLATDLFVLDAIGGLYPTNKLQVDVTEIPQLVLADEEFRTPAHIDILLEAAGFACIA